MKGLSFFKSKLTSVKIIYLLAAAWTAAVIISIVWNYCQIKNSTIKLAVRSARAKFDKDVLYRSWNSMHGGVYAPVTEKTQPNPYLKNVKEREIITPSGILLTLINPAYMTRQVHEIGNEKNKVLGHITSLNPIRPKNAPDEWEDKSLRLFEKNKRENYSIEKINGSDYLRYMKPLLTRKPCLKCHAEQGYKIGDIRGGISVSLPMKPYSDFFQSEILKVSATHAAFWILGLAALFFSRQNIVKKRK